MARAGHGYGLNDIVAYPRNLLMISAAVDCISEVFSLVKLLLVLPATNAVSERSASALRRLKTYLRTTVTEEILNHCMYLNFQNFLGAHGP